MMKCVVVLAPWEIAIICLGSRKVPLWMDPIHAHFNQRWGGGGGGENFNLNSAFYYHHLQMSVLVLLRARVC